MKSTTSTRRMSRESCPPRAPQENRIELHQLALDVFRTRKFEEMRTRVGIVATRWVNEKPMIFKGDAAQGHGRLGTFVPGFGCTIADAVEASCSAYPFFNRKIVTTQAGDRVELVDGGYCANNPTLYAIADATRALGFEPQQIRAGEHRGRRVSRTETAFSHAACKTILVEPSDFAEDARHKYPIDGSATGNPIQARSHGSD